MSRARPVGRTTPTPQAMRAVPTPTPRAGLFDVTALDPSTRLGTAGVQRGRGRRQADDRAAELADVERLSAAPGPSSVARPAGGGRPHQGGSAGLRVDQGGWPGARSAAVVPGRAGRLH